jgi:hypothetical protein
VKTTIINFVHIFLARGFVKALSFIITLLDAFFHYYIITPQAVMWAATRSAATGFLRQRR